MRLIVAGCSGSFAGPTSPASCYLVQVDTPERTWSVVLDLGNGGFGQLQRHVDPMDLDAVFVSHLHPDHCMDLTGLYVYRRYHPNRPATGRLPVHGPAGTGARLHQAYEGLRPGELDEQFDFRDLSDGAVIRVGPLTITAAHVRHPVEAFGFRVEADGAVLAYTGDSDSCPALGELARDADLLLADSAFVEGVDDNRGIHLTARRAAQLAVDAGARRLVLTHLVAWHAPEVCRAEAAEVWPGAVELATLGSAYDLGS